MKHCRSCTQLRSCHDSQHVPTVYAVVNRTFEHEPYNANFEADKNIGLHRIGEKLLVHSGYSGRNTFRTNFLHTALSILSGVSCSRSDKWTNPTEAEG